MAAMSVSPPLEANSAYIFDASTFFKGLRSISLRNLSLRCASIAIFLENSARDCCFGTSTFRTTCLILLLLLLLLFIRLREVAFASHSRQRCVRDAMLNVGGSLPRACNDNDFA